MNNTFILTALLLINGSSVAQDLNFIHRNDFGQIPVHQQQTVTNLLCLPDYEEEAVDVELSLSGEDTSWALVDDQGSVKQSILLSVTPDSCEEVRVRFSPTSTGRHFTIINISCPVSGSNCDASHRVDAEVLSKNDQSASEDNYGINGGIDFGNARISNIYFRNNGKELVLDSETGIAHSVTIGEDGSLTPASPSVLPQQNNLQKSVCVTTDNELVSIGGSDAQLVGEDNELIHRYSFDSVPSPKDGWITAGDENTRLILGGCDDAYNDYGYGYDYVYDNLDTDAYIGRLEVKVDGKWGTVCDDEFDTKETEVACRSLGFSPKNPNYIDLCGGGQGSIFLDDLDCWGNETNLFECNYREDHNCGHYEDVGIACNSASRIIEPCFATDEKVQWFCGSELCSFSLPEFRAAANLSLSQVQGFGQKEIDNVMSKAFIDSNTAVQANSSYLELLKFDNNATHATDSHSFSSSLALLAAQPEKSRIYVVEGNEHSGYYLSRIAINSTKGTLEVNEKMLNLTGLSKPKLAAASKQGILVVQSGNGGQLAFYRESGLFQQPEQGGGIDQTVIYAASGAGAGTALLVASTVTFVAVYIKCRRKGMDHRQATGAATAASVAVATKGAKGWGDYTMNDFIGGVTNYLTGGK